MHTKFKQLVEDLIDFHLKDIQVSEEAFVRACNISKSPSDKKVFDQILAVDNFVAFKKLMVNRNRELEHEVHKSMGEKMASEKMSTKKESCALDKPMEKDNKHIENNLKVSSE